MLERFLFILWYEKIKRDPISKERIEPYDLSIYESKYFAEGNEWVHEMIDKLLMNIRLDAINYYSSKPDIIDFVAFIHSAFIEKYKNKSWQSQ